jgi:hypothetical protein
MGFKVWTQYVTQAYLQSAGILALDVYVDKPAPELELNADQALKLLRPLCGLADSGEFCIVNWPICEGYCELFSRRYYKETLLRVQMLIDSMGI